MIKDEVKNEHLSRFPGELDIIKKFESDFDINWAKRINQFNTNLSVYFIKPLNHILQTFGFYQELLLAISDYNVPEARFVQAVEHTFGIFPAKGRVDQTVAIIVSKSDAIKTWVENYISRNPQGRAYVGLSSEGITNNNDPWYIRNILSGQLFSRDLFDYTLPVNEDLFFFGRQQIVAEHIDSIKKSENRGIFGLRKTGKTSILFKLRRQCATSNINVIYYDCKIPSIYEMSGENFLDRISTDISNILGNKIKGWKGKNHAVERFMSLINLIPDGNIFSLMFDEIEYISPSSLTATHWKDDFIPFWQTIWSAQSQYRKFNFIIAGVNASVVETDNFGGIQNPMFGIVKPRYVTGLEKSELFSLLSVFGKRMGMNFDDQAVSTLHSRYGGHPLLTRMVCSHINNEIKASRTNRPVTIDKNRILSDIHNREQEIEFYCAHITSELERFYSSEYEMLELLATGNIVDFNELSEDATLIRHLKSYSLVDFSVPFIPKFAIPVIQSYIASKWKRKNGEKTERYIVPEHRRNEYVAGRLSSAVRDIRSAEKKFETVHLPPLYRGMGPSEAEIFTSLGPAHCREELTAFLNQCSRSLLEPIDKTGSTIGKNNYFFSEIKNSYSTLWRSLNKIRTYRNYMMHPELNSQAQIYYNEYISEDFDGKKFESIKDGWFRLQSCILDGLLIGIQSELSKYD